MHQVGKPSTTLRIGELDIQVGHFEHLRKKRKVKRGKIFRKPFSVFYLLIFRSKSNIFR